MKNNLILFVLLVGTVCLINSCKKNSSSSESPTTGTNVADASYYPAGDGTSYKYNIDRTDSSGIQSSGERTTHYSGTQLIGNTTYQVEVDSINISGFTTVGLSYFRKDNNSVSFLLDTTGLVTSTPAIIPYLQYLTLDSEMKLLTFPISDNSNWSVFKMTINASGLSFSPVEVTTAYDGKETLTLNLNSGNVDVETVRLKFTLKVQTNPLNPPQSFVAYCWLEKDIGIVKWDGNGAIVGAFTGNGIDFADTTSTVIMNVNDYNISQ